MRKRAILGAILILAGAAAVLSAGGLWLTNVRDENRAADYSGRITEDLFARINHPSRLTRPVASPEPIQTVDATDAVVGGADAIVIDDTKYIGILSIPKLELSWAVNNTWSDALLKKTPCRYSGSVQNDSVVIAAHNYDRHFGRLSSLSDGDIVSFTDPDGTEHRYQVAVVETIKPSDADTVINSEYGMTLFTCTFGGRARVVVRCMRV